MRFHGPPPFDLVVSIVSVEAAKRACERRGWTALETGVPGRLRIEGAPEGEEPPQEDANGLGKSLRRWIRTAHLSKAETIALARMSPEEAAHLFAGRFETLGAERLRSIEAKLRAALRK